jgi:CheY-like chemotaxis protein
VETEMVSARASAATSGRVLVVDDDPTVSDVVRRYLERAGYDVDKAADGPTALALAAERPPDLVVLDLMLPGMSGLEVCRRLRGAADGTGRGVRSGRGLRDRGRRLRDQALLTA